jgi:hypothetical protein
MLKRAVVFYIFTLKFLPYPKIYSLLRWNTLSDEVIFLKKTISTFIIILDLLSS